MGGAKMKSITGRKAMNRFIVEKTVALTQQLKAYEAMMDTDVWTFMIVNEKLCLVFVKHIS